MIAANDVDAHVSNGKIVNKVRVSDARAVIFKN
jgi:hypothetical protein